MMNFNDVVGPNQQTPQVQTYPDQQVPPQAYPNQQPGQPYGYQQQQPGLNNQPNYAGNSTTLNNNINPIQQTYPAQQVPQPAYANQQPAQLPGYQQQQPAAISSDTPFYNLIGRWKMENQTGYREFMRVSHIM